MTCSVGGCYPVLMAMNDSGVPVVQKLDANISGEANGAKSESDDERLHRLHFNPGDATVEDLAWLTTMLRASHMVTDQFRARAVKAEDELQSSRNKPGRVLGLREAADLIRAARQKEVVARVLVGKREHAVRAMNAKLLENVAALIERYAADAEAGRLG